MQRKFIRGMYLWNLVLQSIFSLLTPIGVSTLIAYLLVGRGVGSWIYAVLILFGVLVGLSSMIRFLLGATAQIERLENEHAQKEKEKRRL